MSDARVQNSFCRVWNLSVSVSFRRHLVKKTHQALTGSRYGSGAIQLFDVTLEAYFGRHLLCIHAPTCGYGPALEYNGDLYSCDHFVEPRYLLGNIHDTHMLNLVASDQQRKFGDDKRDSLTAQCRSCAVRPLCNGGCPKDRFAVSRDGDPG
jgi:uncharacterized protein